MIEVMRTVEITAFGPAENLRLGERPGGLYAYALAVYGTAIFLSTR